MGKSSMGALREENLCSRVGDSEWGKSHQRNVQTQFFEWGKSQQRRTGYKWGKSQQQVLLWPLLSGENPISGACG